jgi:hypothetical protein
LQRDDSPREPGASYLTLWVEGVYDDFAADHSLALLVSSYGLCANVL